MRTTIVHMPAVNTPQFDWVEQPEIAAQALVYAADHPQRREYWVGASTVGTILANKIAPGLLDRYLARTGYRSQQTDQPRDPDQPANLWEPADGRGRRDYGAHGSFDDRAHTRCYQSWLSQHRRTVAGAAAVAGVAALTLLRR